MSEQRQQLANNLLNILQQKKGESKGISNLSIPMKRPFTPKAELASVEEQGKLGDVEMRADLDPYISNTPLAQLGYKLFEQGKVSIQGIPFDRLQPGVEDKAKYTGSRGLFIPSEEDIDTDYERRRFEQLDKYGIKRQPIPSGGLATFNFMRDILPPKDGLNTLNHELAHAGFKYLYDNLDELSLDDGKFVVRELSRNQPGIPDQIQKKGKDIRNEEQIIDEFEYQIAKQRPDTKISKIDIFERAKLLEPISMLQSESDKDLSEFAKDIVPSNQERGPAFFNERVAEKFNEIANKELRKMNVPEKKEQLGTFGKLKQYFEGIF